MAGIRVRQAIGVSEKKPHKTKLDVSHLPMYCDFNCPQASFAPNDAVGACRRELAIYCNLLAAFNTNRMVREYTESMYLASLDRYRNLSDDNFKRTRNF